MLRLYEVCLEAEYRFRDDEGEILLPQQHRFWSVVGTDPQEAIEKARRWYASAPESHLYLTGGAGAHEFSDPGLDGRGVAGVRSEDPHTIDDMLHWPLLGEDRLRYDLFPREREAGLEFEVRERRDPRPFWMEY